MGMASIAQTHFLLQCWANRQNPPVLPDEPNKTLAACVKRGWMAPTGEEYVFANGQIGIRHCVTRDGLAAAAAQLNVIVGLMPDPE